MNRTATKPAWTFRHDRLTPWIDKLAYAFARLSAIQYDAPCERIDRS